MRRGMRDALPTAPHFQAGWFKDAEKRGVGMRRLFWAGLVIVMAGCRVGVETPTNNEDTPTPTPTQDPTSPVQVQSVSPTEGPRGTTVEIHGVGFGTDSAVTVVRWGSVEIPPDSQTDTVITVTAPSMGGGTVDVEVVTPEGTGLLTSAYTFRGGYGSVVTIEFLEYENPAQFNPAGETTISAYAAFLLPELDTLTPVITGQVPEGSCVFNPAPLQATVEPIDVGPDVTLKYNSLEIPIPKNGSFYFPSTSSTDLSGYISNSKYDIVTSGGTANPSLPAMVVPDAVQTSQTFTINSPNIGGSPFNTVPKANELVFTWSTSFPATAMGIQLSGYKLTGAADDGYTGNVLECTASDANGTFTVTAAELAKLTLATHVVVLMSRRAEQTAIMAENQESLVEAIGYHSKIGVLEFN